MKSTSQWIQGVQSVVDNDRGHEVTIDLPPGQGGGDTGATALELAVMGLSGCVGTIFASVAKNSSFSFEAMRVVVTADKGERTIETAGIKVYIKTDDEKKAARLLDKTMAICPVGILFEQGGVKMDLELICE